MFKAKVYITLKDSILDPQGTAVKKALESLEYKNIDELRIGKMVYIKINETDRQKAEAQLKNMCEKLLYNSVIENYTYELEG
ncbi:MAG: phosphoribosylformylglycinamidine synthase subunit PurS [Spirochaetota bacterium]|nr:phosphoribosylformylglycinamidine synthase subunit PurS [Spirochaetota bacterium]